MQMAHCVMSTAEKEKEKETHLASRHSPLHFGLSPGLAVPKPLSSRKKDAGEGEDDEDEEGRRVTGSRFFRSECMLASLQGMMLSLLASGEGSGLRMDVEKKTTTKERLSRGSDVSPTQFSFNLLSLWTEKWLFWSRDPRGKCQSGG